MAKVDDNAVLLESFPVDGLRVDASAPEEPAIPKQSVFKKKSGPPSKTGDRRLAGLKDTSDPEQKYRSFRADVLELAMAKDKAGYDLLVDSAQELFGDAEIHVPPYELPVEPYRRPRSGSVMSRLLQFPKSANDDA